jgi:hypothetical protein
MLRIFSIPDPGSKRFRITDPRQRIKVFLTSKNFFYALRNMIRDVHPRSGSLFFTHPGCQIQGVKKAPYPGSATLILKPVQGAEVKPGGRMFESSPVFHLGGLSEREQTIGLLERGTVVTR